MWATGVRRAVVAAIILSSGCAGDGGSEERPPASECEDGTYPMRAFPFDESRGCVSTVPVVVGCTPDEDGTDDAPCVKRLSDGALFIATQGSPFRGSPEWEECGEADSQRLNDVSCEDEQN